MTHPLLPYYPWEIFSLLLSHTRSTTWKRDYMPGRQGFIFSREEAVYTLCTTEHWINVASFEYFIILINHCSVYFKIILKNQKYLKIKSWTINIYFKILLYILLFQSNSIPWCWKFFSKENSKWDILKSEYRKYFLVQDCSFEDLDPRD